MTSSVANLTERVRGIRAETELHDRILSGRSSGVDPLAESAMEKFERLRNEKRGDGRSRAA